MHSKQRVELLHAGRTQDFSYWANRNHSVYLCKRDDESSWQAIVNGEVVVDRTHPFDESRLLYPVAPLEASSPQDLAPLLALQERLHVILDAEESWRDEGPLSLERRGSDRVVGA